MIMKNRPAMLMHGVMGVITLASFQRPSGVSKKQYHDTDDSEEPVHKSEYLIA